MDDKIIYGLEVRTRCLIVTPKLKCPWSEERGMGGLVADFTEDRILIDQMGWG